MEIIGKKDYFCLLKMVADDLGMQTSFQGNCCLCLRLPQPTSDSRPCITLIMLSSLNYTNSIYKPTAYCMDHHISFIIALSITTFHQKGHS